MLSALSNTTIDQNSAWHENEIFDFMEALLSVYENWPTFEREHEKQAPMKTMQIILSALLFSAGCNVADKNESCLSDIKESNLLFLKQSTKQRSKTGVSFYMPFATQNDFVLRF
jgi:hypothetical protein